MEVVFGPEIFGQRHGGISRYFVEVHQRLAAYGVPSTIVAGAHHNAYLAGRQRVRGFLVPLALQKERIRPAREGVNDLVASAYLRSRPAGTVYHQTYYGGRAGGRHRGPHVVSAYDLVHARFPEHFLAADPTVAQQRAAFSAADLIVAISQTTKDDLQTYFGIDPERVAVTHLGVTPAPARPSTRTGRDKPFLLYVGQRYGYKNWNGFVRGFAASRLMPDVDVVSIGAGPFSAEERALLAELRLSAQIHHVTADDSLLDAHYREAVAFVYPSLYEGFGLPPLEAMARGCPVVASRTGAVPEILGDAAVYIDPTDVDSIAAALESVVDSGRRTGLSTAGRALADRYTWDRTAEQTVAAYERLA